MDNSHLFWAINVLNNQGYQIDNTFPTIIQETPWSTVYRFKTKQGFIFLKKIPDALSIEPRIINILYSPIFSFLNCLHRAKENFSLSESEYQQLIIDCLNPWLAIETQEHLFEILILVQQCWSIHSVLSELRLIKSVDEAAFQKLRRQGRLSTNLRYWIDQ
jgi:hypothetical protein